MALENLKNSNNFDLFNPTTSNIQNEVINIESKNLIHYRNHKFKLYSGQKHDDMVESIKQFGIIQPIIVRPIPDNDFDFEILSGHNRYECGKTAELAEFPCIVRENLTDDEAEFYVIRTNIDQRSLADLPHSERAIIIYSENEANKKQGKRNDLLKDIDEIISTFENEPEKMNTNEKISNQFDLSKDDYAKYLRVYKLSREFQELLDENEMSLSTAALLSFLKTEEQEVLYDYLVANNQKVLVKHATELKQLSKINKFNTKKIEEIFKGKKIDKKKKVKSTLQIKWKNLDTFFTENETEEQIESTIVKALTLYFEANNSENKSE